MRILAIRGKNLASLRGEFELRLDQPPISCKAKSGVPLCTCQLAQVCRRSCQRKSSIPAVCNAAYHAFVLTCVIGLPL